MNRIEQLLSQPEGKTLEFKRDLSSPKPMLKTLVAFANTAGGRLIVGVDYGKNIVGVVIRWMRKSVSATGFSFLFFDSLFLDS